MTIDESLEVTRIHSVAGLLPDGVGLVDRRAFRTPHHHISLAGLIGGGTGLAKPGEISLAHHGVLFLDEVGLYSAHVLDSLRTPLEEGVVRIARAGGVISYPCRFSLVGAMNPCPCGYEGDALRACRCSERQLQQYHSRLSGPLLDRFDLQVGVARARRNELMSEPMGESSDAVRERVESAREIQRRRYGSSLVTNASAPGSLLETGLLLSAEARRDAGDAIDALALSGRGLDRVLRVARTMADLDGSASVESVHIHTALHFRNDGSEREAA
jgi:magnesium chelatase family protein